MKDGIVIAEALHGEVRIHAACTTHLVEEARIHHTAMPTSIAALGRVMTVTAIMASDLKNKKEKVQAVFNGKGPIGTVLAQADGAGNVKGFAANPNVYLVRKDGHLAVGEGIGTDGTLTVTRDMGLKEPFTSTVALQSGEVGDDFAYYYALSEQVPSVVGVGVLVNPQGKIQAAGGLIYQLMPKASEETIEFCEAAAKAQQPVSELIDKGTDLEEVIRTYFPDANVLAHRDVRFYCGCSKEKFMDSLSALHDKDLQEMIDDGKGAEIVCQYCSTKYNFSTEELKEILEKKHRVEDR
ncbi:MAG: Hsp33 family molecular chaperone HslO [Erysipelotrichaceae bacterium]|jgi:molecular chaperone Hsp33|nr:Hsp33 family molecular chaperone HslO [Erysipelotrichaceae bacterium]